MSDAGDRREAGGRLLYNSSELIKNPRAERRSCGIDVQSKQRLARPSGEVVEADEGASEVQDVYVSPHPSRGTLPVYGGDLPWGYGIQ